jgi:hypothetical protein
MCSALSLLVSRQILTSGPSSPRFLSDDDPPFIMHGGGSSSSSRGGGKGIRGLSVRAVQGANTTAREPCVF